jgi:hypothetical protein
VAHFAFGHDNMTGTSEVPQLVSRLTLCNPQGRRDGPSPDSCTTATSAGPFPPCQFRVLVCPHEGINAQFPNGIVSSVAFVSTTNTARSLAGFVLLALAGDAVAVAGQLGEALCPAL